MSIENLVVRLVGQGSSYQKMIAAATAQTTGFQKTVQMASTQIARVGQATTKAGKALTLGVTAPLIASGSAAVKLATDINEAMANIGSLGIENDRLQVLKQGIQDVAISTAKSTNDIADGVYQVVSAFGDTSDTLKILEVNARAATAGLATTEEAINLTSAVTKGYGDTSLAATQRVSDLAFTAVRLGQTNFPELARSVGRVVPLMKTLGGSQEELFAVMATATGVTGKASEVSTQLRGILQSLLAPTGDMCKAFKEARVRVRESHARTTRPSWFYRRYC